MNQSFFSTVRKFVLLLIICSGFVGMIISAETSSLEAGSTVPELEAYSIEGLPISLHPPENKMMLLLFWDITDENIDETVVDAYVLYKRFHEEGLKAVGIYANQSEDTLFSFAEHWQIPWPQVISNEEINLFQRLGIKDTPSNLLIDTQGKIIAKNLKGKEAHEFLSKQFNVSLNSLPMPESPTVRPDRPQPGMIVGFGAPASIYRPANKVESMLGTPQERKQAEKCKQNLRKISIALTDYKKDHDGELPNWLSELYPDYLQDESILLCPTDPTRETSFQNAVDPHMKCSYLYEFAPTEGLGRNYREWKTVQLSQFGDKVPIISCLKHQRRLNLSYGGEIYFSSLGWESSVPQGKTLTDPAAQVRKTFRQLASAFDKYKKEHDGNLPPELEDLYPKYVKDKTLFTCPVTGAPFSYQFSLNEGQRERKIAQLKQFGGYVPVMRSRAVLDNGLVINLAYNGEIYSSESVWENHFTPQQVSAEQSSSQSVQKNDPRNVARAEADLRTLATALEMFLIDNNQYPVPQDGNTIDKAEIKYGDTRVITLTSPVRYIRELPKDPFSAKNETYRYNSNGKDWWILASDGPDGKPSLDLKKYDSTQNFGQEELKEYTYHPSNGVTSSGDLFRTGPK